MEQLRNAIRYPFNQQIQLGYSSTSLLALGHPWWVRLLVLHVFSLEEGPQERGTRSRRRQKHFLLELGLRGLTTQRVHRESGPPITHRAIQNTSLPRVLCPVGSRESACHDRQIRSSPPSLLECVVQIAPHLQQKWVSLSNSVHLCRIHLLDAQQIQRINYTFPCHRPLLQQIQATLHQVNNTL